MPETPNIVIESQNTSFSRVGETYQTIVRTTPTTPTLATLVQQYIADPTVIPGGTKLAAIQAESESGYPNYGNLISLLNTILANGTPSAQYPNASALQTLLTTLTTPYTPLTTYPHFDDLESILTQVKANAPLFESSTSSLYAHSFAVALATAQSGPTNVRGGTAQQGFELAELATLYSINRFKEVWQAQVQAWELESQLVKLANDVPLDLRKEWLAEQVATLQTIKLLNDIPIELRNQTMRAWDQQLQCYKLSNDIPSALRAQWLQAQAQQAASEHSQRADNIALAEVYNAFNKTLVDQFAAVANFGQSTMRTEESFTGQGTQSGITTGFGMSSYR